MMAIIMKKAPIPVTIVTISFKIEAEIATATTISVSSRIVDVEAEMCLSPSSHK